MSLNLALSIPFQREILCLIIKDRNFATKFFSLIMGDKDLSKLKISIFSSPLLSQIANLQKDLFVKGEGLLPTSGIFENEVMEIETSEANKSNIINEHKKLIEMKVEFNTLHEKALVELVLIAKTTSFTNNMFSQFETPNKKMILGFSDKCRKFLDQIDAISLSDDDEVDMNDFTEIIKQYADTSISNIRFNVYELCDELNGGGETGGVAKQEVTVWLAATNDGKSLLMTSILCDALRAGECVLMVALEGKRLQAPMRIISNLTNIKYRRLVRFREYIHKNDHGTLSTYFTEEELESITEAQELWSEKVKVVHAIKNCEIEKIEAKLFNAFKSRYYGMVIIDYGQLIESVQSHNNTDLLLSYVFRRLEKAASALKTSINVPMQTNRYGMSELKADFEAGEEYPTYKMSHVAGGYSALKTAGCVIILSRTEQERSEGKIRLSIAKQREGLVGVHVGIQADFEHCNLTRGERFYVNIPGVAQNKIISNNTMTAMGIKTDNSSIITIVNELNILKELSEYEDGEETPLANLTTKIKAIHGKTTILNELIESVETDLLQGTDENQGKTDEIEKIKEEIFELKYSDDDLQRLFLDIFKTPERISEFLHSNTKIQANSKEVQEEFPMLAKLGQLIVLSNELELLTDFI